MELLIVLNMQPGRGKLGRTLLAAASLALMLIGLGAPARAGTATATMAVSLTITASCTINTATLAFGSNSGTTLVSGTIPASTTVSVTCTSGSPYSIGMDNGQNYSAGSRRMINGSNYISYGIYTDTNHTYPWTTASSSTACTSSNSCALGTGNGTAQLVNIYGLIPSTGTAPATGAYSDTVTMTITY